MVTTPSPHLGSRPRVDPFTGEILRRAEQPEDSGERAARRARVNVRRLARVNALRYMDTLTFGSEGEQSYERARSGVAEFLRQGPGRRLYEGHHLTVFELHPKGHGWHAHISHPERTESAQLWEDWTRYAMRQGYTSPTGRIRVDCKDWGSAVRAAGYMSKYVGKAFDKHGLPAGTRRFTSGYALVRPVPVVGELLAVDLQDLRNQLRGLGVPANAREFTTWEDAEKWPVLIHEWEAA